jgi:hypothetical protein
VKIRGRAGIWGIVDMWKIRMGAYLAMFDAFTMRGRSQYLAGFALTGLIIFTRIIREAIIGKWPAGNSGAGMPN